MKPDEIVRRIQSSGRQHYVFRVGRQVVAARKDSATLDRLENTRGAELIGCYGKAATAAMIAEDLRA